ncbi:MAG: CAP domain-containing protein [Spirochaetes bacterium]|nr:CAP domain-containing protein [Spirochaetota bacterium]
MARQPPTPRLPSIAEIEAEIVRLINGERVAGGLSPLTPDAVLGAVARAHSRDMVTQGYFSHENPLGEGPDERAEKAGYDVHRPMGGGVVQGIGENIGMIPVGMVEDIGFVEQEAGSIAAAQARSWMASRSHRANILSPDFERTGVGVAHDGKGMYTCTQVFW